MEKIIIFALLSSILFCLLKFLEMKYLEKEFKPLKVIIRDALIVFVSSFVSGYVILESGLYIIEFFNIVTENKDLKFSEAKIFTDSPGF